MIIRKGTEINITYEQSAWEDMDAALLGKWRVRILFLLMFHSLEQMSCQKSGHTSIFHATTFCRLAIETFFVERDNSRASVKKVPSFFFSFVGNSRVKHPKRSHLGLDPTNSVV